MPPLNAMKIGARAFAMFTKNQRQWVAKPLTTKSIDSFRRNLEESNIKPNMVLPHDSYPNKFGESQIERSLPKF